MKLFFLSALLILTTYSAQATESDPFNTLVLDPLLRKKEITQEEATILKKDAIEIRETLSNPNLSSEAREKFWEFVEQIDHRGSVKLK